MVLSFAEVLMDPERVEMEQSDTEAIDWAVRICNRMNEKAKKEKMWLSNTPGSKNSLFTDQNLADF